MKFRDRMFLNFNSEPEPLNSAGGPFSPFVRATPTKNCGLRRSHDRTICKFDRIICKFDRKRSPT